MNFVHFTISIKNKFIIFIGRPEIYRRSCPHATTEWPKAVAWRDELLRPAIVSMRVAVVAASIIMIPTFAITRTIITATATKRSSWSWTMPTMGV